MRTLLTTATLLGVAYAPTGCKVRFADPIDDVEERNTKLVTGTYVDPSPEEKARETPLEKSQRHVRKVLHGLDVLNAAYQEKDKECAKLKRKNSVQAAQIAALKQEIEGMKVLLKHLANPGQDAARLG